jgi:hypothetical protein
MTQSAVPAALDAVAFLLGEWRGAGRGHYPTISDFTYEEEVRFWHTGKPFLVYTQRTWGPDGTPLHSEMGYWRPQDDGRVEIVLAHPMGITEIQEGVVEGRRIRARSTSMSATPTAKEILSVSRTYEFDGEVLSYRLGMAAVGQPHQGHLEGALRRSGA